MRRELLCCECRSKLIGKLGHYEGEYHDFKSGKSKGHYVCDACMTPLPPGTECYAFSIWTDERPRYDWEDEYID